VVPPVAMPYMRRPQARPKKRLSLYTFIVFNQHLQGLGLCLVVAQSPLQSIVEVPTPQRVQCSCFIVCEVSSVLAAKGRNEEIAKCGYNCPKACLRRKLPASVARGHEGPCMKFSLCCGPRRTHSI
jgi:hypothetical protein